MPGQLSESQLARIATQAMRQIKQLHAHCGASATRGLANKR